MMSNIQHFKKIVLGTDINYNIKNPITFHEMNGENEPCFNPNIHNRS